MAEKLLNILYVQSTKQSSSETPSSISRKAHLKDMLAKFERLWLTQPERFNPLRNCMERERLERTWRLLFKYLDIVNLQVADIGCGAGVFSRRLRDHGAHVEGIDIARNALKRFEENGCERIKLIQDAMPNTALSDQIYDVIICTELIAELPKNDYRLFFAELSRLVKADGRMICSSAIDINSDEGVEKLAELAQTEFDILDEVVSYHALYIRLKQFFKAPALFIEGWKNPDVKKKELATRKGLNRLCFWLNSSSLFVWVSYLINPFAHMILRILNSCPRLMMSLEKFCRFIWDQKGISHYLFIARKRPLLTADPSTIPVEKPHKKEIWE